MAKTTKDKPSAAFQIVGIGASAGGFTACEELVAAIPPDTRSAFVIIIHSLPDEKHYTADLLSRRAKIPVLRMRSGNRIRPGRVYIAPAGTDIAAREEKLVIEKRFKRGVLHKPVDAFLSSLAEDAGKRSAAVILSGTGNDGSQGARKVREAGGTVVAQSIETAEFAAMPQSIVQSGTAHAALAPSQIPGYLREEYGKTKEVASESPHTLERIINSSER